MKKIVLFIAMFSFIGVYAQAPYSDNYWQGSIAIVGYNTHGGVVGNGDQSIALIILKPMDQGTTIHVTNKSFGKNFTLGTDAFPLSSGQTGRIDLEFTRAVSPGQIITLQGVNKSSGATVSFGDLITDGKFQLKNNELWYFYVTSDANPDKPETFCSAFVWGDTWTVGSGGNAYDGLALAGLTDGKNAMKTDITNNAWKCGVCTGLTFNLDGALTNIESSGLYNGSVPAVVLNNTTNDGSGGNWSYRKPNNGTNQTGTACDWSVLTHTLNYTPVVYDGANWKDSGSNTISEPDNKFAKDIELNSGGKITSSDIYDSGSGSSAGSKKVRAGKLKVKSGTTLEIEPGDTIQIIDELDVENGGSLVLKASVSPTGEITYPEYYNSLSTLTPGTEISIEQYIVKPYWHHLCSPVSVQLKDLVFDNTVTVNGQTSTTNFALRNASQNVQNIYYWKHNYDEFGWERELDFTSDFSDTAYTIFFLPSEIPVKITATGPLVQPNNDAGLQPTSFFNDFPNNTGTATCNSPGYGAPGYWSNGSGNLNGCGNFEGWNFIRNPFAGFMNWKAAVNANKDAKDYQNNILYNTTVYTWNPDAGSTYQGNNGNNNVTVYGKYGYANVLSNDIDKLSVPPFQAIFVKQENFVDNVDKTKKNDISIDGGAKGKASANKVKYKTSAFDGVRFTIEVEDLDGRKDEVLMYFGDRGSNYYDPAYDAPKFLHSDLRVPLVGTFQDSSIMLGIDAREKVTGPVTIPLSVINSVQGKNLTMKFVPIESITFSVGIKDKVTGKIHDFKDGIYNYQNDTGYYDNRFDLLINQNAVSLEEQVIANSDVLIYFSHDQLSLTANKDLGKSTIVVTNVAGQTLYRNSANLTANNKVEINLEAEGILIISIFTESGAVISQKLVR